MIQETVFIITLGLMGMVLSVFLFVALNAGGESIEYPPIQAKAYAIRTKFFWILIVSGILIAISTTLDLPYDATRGNLINVDKQVDVIGRQWYWELSDSSAKVGETVVFNVSASDVTHGFGVYDEDMRILGQTQAMPGYTNSLKLVFDKAGKYKLLCMEYCGLAHHAMVSEFIVTAQ